MPAILSAEHVSKTYRLYASPWQRLRGAMFGEERAKTFDALRDVSFSLDKGDTLGVIGVNGAGKSTLLKLLAGISAPSSGSLQIHGRISALLELGAGFHPEYTGIENVYLSGTLSGRTKAQMDAVMDDILAFADIGEFVRRPLKTYSSGMFVRLAFAVATSVAPDILLVDEALSVGDAFFQARCVRRMRDLMNQGVSLVFVSHDMGAVKSVCRRAMLLESGQVRFIGPAEEAVSRFFHAKVATEQPSAVVQPTLVPAFEQRAAFGRLGDGRARFIDVCLLNEAGESCELFAFGQRVTLRMRVHADVDLAEVCAGFHILDGTGVDVIYDDTAIERCNPRQWHAGEHTLEWRFRLYLEEGTHDITAVISIAQDMAIGQVTFLDYVPHACVFTMQRRADAKIYAKAYWPCEVSVDGQCVREGET